MLNPPAFPYISKADFQLRTNILRNNHKTKKQLQNKRIGTTRMCQTVQVSQHLQDYNL